MAGTELYNPLENAWVIPIYWDHHDYLQEALLLAVDIVEGRVRNEGVLDEYQQKLNSFLKRVFKKQGEIDAAIKVGIIFSQDKFKEPWIFVQEDKNNQNANRSLFFRLQALVVREKLRQFLGQQSYQGASINIKFENGKIINRYSSFQLEKDIQQVEQLCAAHKPQSPVVTVGFDIPKVEEIQATLNEMETAQIGLEKMIIGFYFLYCRLTGKRSQIEPGRSFLNENELAKPWTEALEYRRVLFYQNSPTSRHQEESVQADQQALTQVGQEVSDHCPDLSSAAFNVEGVPELKSEGKVGKTSRKKLTKVKPMDSQEFAELDAMIAKLSEPAQSPKQESSAEISPVLIDLISYLSQLDIEKDSLLNPFGLFTHTKAEKKEAAEFAFKVAKGEKIFVQECLKHLGACSQGRLGEICNKHGIIEFMAQVIAAYKSQPNIK